jgi:beta-carotene hydroxylase
MKKHQSIVTHPTLPKAADLADLSSVTGLQRAVTLALPFVCAVFYFCFAVLEWWPPAVVSLMYLSFITYGSTSHDLVHGSLGLRNRTNNLFLSVIELLALRSGHAYRAAHLYHHARYPQHDDIEGAASRMSFVGALLEGTKYNLKIYFWALKTARHDRFWIKLEGIVCVLLIASAAFLTLFTPIFLIYVVLMIMGSWILPLMTSYLPHTPDGKGPLFQTRLFRGRVASIIAMEHLYHLEHHLYPSIPHHNWAELGRRLDPVFKQNGVTPTKIWF